MTIGFDIDGTITRCPPFFSLISHALIAAGHRVLIITFREDRNSAANDLRDWNVVYSELITWSYTRYAGQDMYAWKARVCARGDVDILFDDDPQVLSALPDDVLGMMVADRDEHDLDALVV